MDIEDYNHTNYEFISDNTEIMLARCPSRRLVKRQIGQSVINKVEIKVAKT